MPKDACHDGAPGGFAVRRSQRCFRRLRGALVTGFALAAIVCTFWTVISDPDDPRILGSGDSWLSYGPSLHYLDHCLHNGEFPLWNPLIFCGQPHAANPYSWALYPPNIARSLLTTHPTPWKTHAGIVFMVALHLLLAAVSSFYLARSHRMSAGASLVSALAFALSAAMVTRAVGHWVFLNTACWMPLILLCLRAALTGVTGGGKTVAALAAGLALAMSILGGIPSLILPMGVSVAAYGLLLRILYPALGAIPPDPKEPSRGAVPRKRPRRPPAPNAVRFRRVAAGDTLVWVLLAGVAVLVAAPLLVPGAEFAAHTLRADKSRPTGEDFAHVSGLWQVLKILTVYQGHGHYEGPRAAGAGVFGLAVMAVFSRRRRDVLLFAGLFLLLLDTSLSEPVLFGRLVAWIAPFQFSNPGRAMILACLPLGLLAGAGTDALIGAPSGRRGRLLRTALAVSVFLALVLTLVLAERPEPLLDAGPAVVVFPILLAVAAVAAIWVPAPRVWGLLIVLLVFGETFSWNIRLVPSCLEVYDGDTALLRTPQTFWNDNRRRAVIDPNLPMYRLEPAINGYDPMMLRDVVKVLCYTPPDAEIIRRTVLQGEVTGSNLRGHTFLKRPFWLARQFVRGQLPPMSTPFPAATTVFLEDPREVPVPEVDRASLPKGGMSGKVASGHLIAPGAPPLLLRSEELTAGMAVSLANEFPLPREHSAVFMTASTTADVVVRPVFQEKETGRQEVGAAFQIKAGAPPGTHEAALPDMAKCRLSFTADFGGRAGVCTISELAVRCDLNDEDALIRVLSRTANTVEVRVDALRGPRMLTFVDSWYPGWRAYVDGKPARIHRANNAFKAVALSEGAHVVRFVYADPWTWAAVAVSLCTLLAAAATIAVLYARGVRGNRCEEPTIKQKAPTTLS